MSSLNISKSPKEKLPLLDPTKTVPVSRLRYEVLIRDGNIDPYPEHSELDLINLEFRYMSLKYQKTPANRYIKLEAKTSNYDPSKRYVPGSYSNANRCRMRNIDQLQDSKTNTCKMIKISGPYDPQIQFGAPTPQSINLSSKQLDDTKNSCNGSESSESVKDTPDSNALPDSDSDSDSDWAKGIATDSESVHGSDQG